MTNEIGERKIYWMDLGNRISLYLFYKEFHYHVLLANVKDDFPIISKIKKRFRGRVGNRINSKQTYIILPLPPKVGISTKIKKFVFKRMVQVYNFAIQWHYYPQGHMLYYITSLYQTAYHLWGTHYFNFQLKGHIGT